MRYTFLIILFTSILSATFLDDDMDGVENQDDLCPNTPFFAIVDKRGCTIKKLKVEEKPSFSISTGYFYAKDDLVQKSYFLNLSFFYKNFSGYIESSKSDIEDISSQDDTVISLSYTYKRLLSYTFTTGAYLPTDDKKDNKTDTFYKLKISYAKDRFDTFVSYKKTLMNDPKTTDTNSYYIGAGYNFTNSLYSWLTLSRTNSIYDKDISLNYSTLNITYDLTNNFYISTSISKGLNSQSIDKSFSFSLGYNF